MRASKEDNPSVLWSALGDDIEVELCSDKIAVKNAARWATRVQEDLTQHRTRALSPRRKADSTARPDGMSHPEGGGDPAEPNPPDLHGSETPPRLWRWAGSGGDSGAAVDSNSTVLSRAHSDGYRGGRTRRSHSRPEQITSRSGRLLGLQSPGVHAQTHVQVCSLSARLLDEAGKVRPNDHHC